MDVFRNTAVAVTLIVAGHVALVTTIRCGYYSAASPPAAGADRTTSEDVLAARCTVDRARGELDGIREMFEFASEARIDPHERRHESAAGADRPESPVIADVRAFDPSAPAGEGGAGSGVTAFGGWSGHVGGCAIAA